MAASVMGLLGSLARQGKTVICTIHQPSSQLFSAFDRLLLIAEGRTAYLGRAHLARDFFLRSALPCVVNRRTNFKPAIP
jgi:ABC-type multidrug transport system ATPase subunit